MEKRDGKSNKLGGGHKLQRNLVKGKDKRGEDKNKVKFDKLLFGEILLLALNYTYCITTNHHLLSFQQVNQTIISYKILHKEFPLKQSNIKL